MGDIPERGAVADAARCVPTEYERIRISEGSAAPVRFTAAEISDSGVLRVDFEKNSGMTRAKGSDRVYIYIYNTDTREGLLSHPAERRHGKLQMQLPDGWNELNTKMWGFVVDREGRASRSAFVPLTEGGETAAVHEAGASPFAAVVEKDGAPAAPGLRRTLLERGDAEGAEGGVELALVVGDDHQAVAGV